MGTPIKALHRRCRRLKREVVKLLDANSSLSARSALLEDLCNVFATVCQLTFTSHPPERQASSTRYQELQQLESSFLQGLTASPTQQHGSGQGSGQGFGALADVDALAVPWAAAHAAEAVIRSAPRSDPLALYKQLVLQPLPEAETVTAAEVAGLLRDAVMLGAVRLQQLNSGLPVDYAQVEVDLRGVWLRHVQHIVLAAFGASIGISSQNFSHPLQPPDPDITVWAANAYVACPSLARYLHMALSVVVTGRHHILYESSVYNLERLQPDPEGVAQDTERLPALPPLLGLTDQQLQDIAAGIAVFADLLQKIVTEQQELQAACERSSVNLSTTGECLRSTGEKLEAQQQSAARMQALLRKDSALRSAACAWFIGCLSWEQYTTAAVLCWPYPTRVPTLALEVARYYEHNRH